MTLEGANHPAGCSSTDPGASDVPSSRRIPWESEPPLLETLQYRLACLLHKYLGFLTLQPFPSAVYTALLPAYARYRLLWYRTVVPSSSDKHHSLAMFPIACTNPGWKNSQSLLMEPVEFPPDIGTNELPLFLHYYIFKEEQDKFLKIRRLKKSLVF